MALSKWFQLALPTNRVRILAITLEIVIDATRLPGWSHQNPADRIIVDTARLHGLKILTSDLKILKFRHVTSIASRKGLSDPPGNLSCGSGPCMEGKS